MSRMHCQFFDASGLTLEQLQEFGEEFIRLQNAINWYIGDLARHAESIAKSGEDWRQVFPPCSPGLIDRCKAVANAFPKESDREVNATWSQHMQCAKRPDRQKILGDIVAKGLTTDESRKAVQPPSNRPRWLLAVDCNYHIHRHWFSGAGLEAAARVTEWIQRTVTRLKEKGLTDVVCCFDSPANFRKKLTEGWERRYKDRPPKDPELVKQLLLTRDLLTGAGFLCVSSDGFEADDVLASYAEQFQGRVTLLSQDKDLKQCLCDHVNMLIDVEWSEDQTSGEMIPEYKWFSAKQLTEATGLRPDQWAEYQAIMGDPTDGIVGAPGIGEKGAKDLMVTFGTLEGVIKAARSGDERIKEKKREALLILSEQLDVVRQLVTLRRDLMIPMNTGLFAAQEGYPL